MYVSWLRSAKSSSYTWWGSLGIQHLRLQCCEAQCWCGLYGIGGLTCVSFCLSHVCVISGTALISISWKSRWPYSKWTLFLSWVKEEMVNRLPEHNHTYLWFMKRNYALSYLRNKWTHSVLERKITETIQTLGQDQWHQVAVIHAETHNAGHHSRSFSCQCPTIQGSITWGCLLGLSANSSEERIQKTSSKNRAEEMRQPYHTCDHRLLSKVSKEAMLGAVGMISHPPVGIKGNFCLLALQAGADEAHTIGNGPVVRSKLQQQASPSSQLQRNSIFLWPELFITFDHLTSSIHAEVTHEVHSLIMFK